MSDDYDEPIFYGIGSAAGLSNPKGSKLDKLKSVSDAAKAAYARRPKNPIGFRN